MHIDTRELAWAAGLFEGEGSFILQKSNQQYAHVRGVRAVLCSTDGDVVLRFSKAIGLGSICLRGNYPGHLGKKQVFQWSTSSFEHFQVVVAYLWFGLNKRRRKKARELLRAMQEYFDAAPSRQRGRRRPRL